MLGHLVPNPYGADEAPLYYAPRGDSWMMRAWRVMFGKRSLTRH